jgi:hypothetical protein
MPAAKFFARLDLDQISEGTIGARPFLGGHDLKFNSFTGMNSNHKPSAFEVILKRYG